VVAAPFTIRPAELGDCPAINDIYNHYVHTDTCTYQTEPETLEAREAWLARHGREHPVLVLEVAGELLGWGSLSPFHPRAAYRHSVEDSLYVRADAQRRGYGTALLKALLKAAREHGHHTVIALISADKTESIALHERFGFTQASLLREVGYKFNRWLDVAFLQILL